MGRERGSNATKEKRRSPGTLIKRARGAEEREFMQKRPWLRYAVHSMMIEATEKVRARLAEEFA